MHSMSSELNKSSYTEENRLLTRFLVLPENPRSSDVFSSRNGLYSLLWRERTVSYLVHIDRSLLVAVFMQVYQC